MLMTSVPSVVGIVLKNVKSGCVSSPGAAGRLAMSFQPSQVHGDLLALLLQGGCGRALSTAAASGYAPRPRAIPRYS